VNPEGSFIFKHNKLPYKDIFFILSLFFLIIIKYLKYINNKLKWPGIEKLIKNHTKLLCTIILVQSNMIKLKERFNKKINKLIH